MPSTASESYRAELRHLSWSGLAGVWIFKQATPEGAPIFTIQLALAGFFFVSALATDLLEATVIAVDRVPSRSASALRVLLGLRVCLLGLGYLWLLAHLVRVVQIV